MKRITFSVGHGKTKLGRRIMGKFEKRQLAYAKLADTYEGFTIHFATGGWKDATGTLIKEDSMILSVADTNDLGEGPAVLMAEYLRDLFDQSCVLMTIEDLEVVKFI